MKIESVSSEQFAGIREQNISFSDGINVVLGDNESGKSTMISAIYSALVVPSKLDKRSDRNFIFRNFPTSGANTIDVTLRFEADDKHYTAEKIWDRSSTECLTKLKCQDGDLLRGSQADLALGKLIPYSPAVCNNLVFGRQNHEASILSWCYDFFEAKNDTSIDEVRQRIAQAYSAAGGISTDRFASMLEDEMTALSGHWDFEHDRPEKNRGLENPWVNGKGTILESYYSWKRSEVTVKAAASIDEKITTQTQSLASLNKKKKVDEATREDLRSRRNIIENVAQLRQHLISETGIRLRAENALTMWPELARQSEKAHKLLHLQLEKSARETLSSVNDRLKKASALEKDIDVLNKKLVGKEDLSDDLTRARKLETSCERAKAKLTAGKLQADVHLHHGYEAKLLLPDGSEKILSGDVTTDVSGYVRMAIPDVAEITVAPHGLDIDGLQENLQTNSAALNTILSKYNVNDVEALSTLSDTVQSQKNELHDRQSDLRSILGGESQLELHARVDSIVSDPTLVVPDTLAEEIREFLQKADSTSLEAAAAASDNALQALINEYTSEEALQNFCIKEKAYCEELEGKTREFSGLPEISKADFEKQLEDIEIAIDKDDDNIQGIQRNLGSLAAQDFDDLPELEAEANRLQTVWEHEKKKYQDYAQIRTDFEELRAQTGNHFTAFYERFNNNLSRITGNRISLLQTDGLQLQSGNNGITASDFLSEGTRKTLLLAFRLAVLSSYLPDDGGLVVLDDDLLDMDPKRRECAASLLRDFARNNQVIFTTCDPTIATLLGGNQIKL